MTPTPLHSPSAPPRRRRLLAAVAAAALIAPGLAACGGDDATDADAAGSGEPVAITDDQRKRVQLGAPAKRVVAIEWEAAENVRALGVAPVGIGDADVYRDWVAAGEAMPESTVSVGTRAEASLDKIASLKPDLIVAGRDATGNRRAALEKIAPVATFDIAPLPTEDATEWERMEQEVERLGVLLGKEDEAEGLLSDLDATLEAQAKRIKDAGQQGKRVALVQAFTAGKPSARLFDDGAQLVEVMKRLGLENAFDGKAMQWGITSASLEGISRVGDADWLLTLALKDDDPFTETWAKNAAYQRFPVVQAGRVVPIGGDTWTWGGPRSAALAAERIADAVTGVTKPYPTP